MILFALLCLGTAVLTAPTAQGAVDVAITCLNNIAVRLEKADCSDSMLLLRRITMVAARFVGTTTTVVFKSELVWIA